MRIQFQAVIHDSEGFSLKVFPAVKCNELYAREIANGDAFYATEFKEDGWMCPNVRSIDIINNPFQFSHGENFLMTVNDCTLATDKEK